MQPTLVIGSSYGNDSVALLQWFYEEGLTHNAVALFNNTGWAKKGWIERVTAMEAWARSLGFATSRTHSVGMVPLVEGRKGWPRQGMQFCTDELKSQPTIRWLAEFDPEGKAICVNGKRRAESVNRRGIDEFIEESVMHGGRLVWSPLYLHSHEERDALIGRAGFQVLPHRSMECFPCVNSKRADIRLLATDEERIELIERVEDRMHRDNPGKIKTMFRPYRHMGATGIREIVKWGLAEHGTYGPEDLDDGGGYSDGCDGGFCSG